MGNGTLYQLTQMVQEKHVSIFMFICMFVCSQYVQTIFIYIWNRDSELKFGSKMLITTESA